MCLTENIGKRATTRTPGLWGSMVHVFGKGFLDLFDEVLWMLPFNSERQAARVRQDNNVLRLDKPWDACRKIIRDDQERASPFHMQEPSS